jgi:WD40 repeat protein
MSVIFITHSSKDDDAAKEIAAWLKARDFDSIFLDFDPVNGIPAGRNWEQELYRKLRQCRAVIVLCSEHSMASDWCFAEITHARSLGKHLFPLKIAPCTLRPILSDIQTIDLTDGSEEGYQRLWNGLIRAGLDPKDFFQYDRKRPPYPGLFAFTKQDAAVFFGREDSIREGLDTLNNLRQFGGARLVVFLGASGSGKSSLVRAGLAPRLERDLDAWLIIDPFRPRQNPFDELAIVLSEAFARHGECHDRQTLGEQLRQAAATVPPDGRVLVDLTLEIGIAADQRDACVVLIVDQLEELLSANTNTPSNLFLPFLHAALATQSDQLMVLSTLRSDFLGDFQNHPALRGLPFEEVMVGPLTVDGYAKVIEGPAEVAGLELEPGLSELLVKDTDTEDALPLLAFTLRELWERWGQGGVLTVENYRDKLGGLYGSVQRAADAVINAEPPSQLQEKDLQRAFLTMVRINEEGQYARRPVRWDHLPQDSHSLLQRFVEARLLISGKEDGILEVAHEALLRNWPRLKHWLDGNREFLLWRQRLKATIADWQAKEKDIGALLRGAVLTEAERWLHERPGDLDGSEREFVERSIQQKQTEQEVELKRRRKIFGGLAVGMLIAIALGGLAWWQRDTALTAQTIAQKQTLAASAQAALSNNHSDLALALALTANRDDARIENHLPEVRQAPVDAAYYSPGTLRLLTGHADKVLSVAFSPDERAALSGSADGSIILWDLASGKEIRRFTGDKKNVTSLVFSPDRKFALSGSADGGLTLWDLGSGREKRRFTGHAKGITSTAFSSDGGLALSGSTDGSLILWDLTAGTEIRRFIGSAEGIASLAFKPDSRVALFGAKDGRLRVLDVTNGDTITTNCFREIHPYGVRTLAIGGNGEVAIAGPSHFDLIQWNVMSCKRIRNLEGHVNHPISAAVSDDGVTALSGCAEGMILWNLQAGKEIRRFTEHKDDVTSVALSSNGRTALSGSADGSVRWWDIHGAERQRISVSTDRPVAFISDSRILTSRMDGMLIKLDIATGKIQGFEQRLGVSDTMAINTVKNIALTGMFRDNSLILWDIKTGQVIKYLGRHARGISSVAIDPKGNIAASASYYTGDNSLRLWDIETGKEITPGFNKNETDDVTSMDFSPDGLKITSGSWDHHVRIWDIGTGRKLGDFDGHTEAVFTVAFSPDGRTLVSGSQDKGLIFWDIETAQIIRRITEHTLAVGAVAFNSNGDTLLSGSSDRSIRLWDVRTGRQIGHFTGHTGGIKQVMFSSDDGIALSSSWDKTIRLWRADPPNDLIGWSCKNRHIHQFTPAEQLRYGVEPYDCDE